MPLHKLPRDYFPGVLGGQILFYKSSLDLSVTGLLGDFQNIANSVPLRTVDFQGVRLFGMRFGGDWMVQAWPTSSEAT